jgi:hypothetical protein
VNVAMESGNVFIMDMSRKKNIIGSPAQFQGMPAITNASDGAFFVLDCELSQEEDQEERDGEIGQRESSESNKRASTLSNIIGTLSLGYLAQKARE